MEKERLDEILKAHAEWLETRLTDDVKGEQANLSGADLSGANLRGADLYGANLSGAKLSGANLRGADLYGVNLSGADLFGANLSGANLRGTNLYGDNLSGANLRGANLYGANLSGADLSGANLRGANLSGANLFGANLRGANMRGDVCPICCPEKGSFIGFKKVQGDYIVELRITETAKRSSATTRRCRCSEAVVMSIKTIEGKEAEEKTVFSTYDPDFSYTVGETVSVDNFDKNRWNECAPGIHFFITREEAVNYE